jgi:hypothetical protein
MQYQRHRNMSGLLFESTLSTVTAIIVLRLVSMVRQGQAAAFVQ